MAKCSRAVENFKYTNIETSDCELFVNFECVCVQCACVWFCKVSIQLLMQYRYTQENSYLNEMCIAQSKHTHKHRRIMNKNIQSIARAHLILLCLSSLNICADAMQSHCFIPLHNYSKHSCTYRQTHWHSHTVSHDQLNNLYNSKHFWISWLNIGRNFQYI